MIISPCISICKTDPKTGFCYGCGRNNEEKKIWKLKDTSDQWKNENIKSLKKRLSGWQLKSFEEAGYGDFPICIAKTQYSFSTDPSLKGAPTGHALPIREIRLSSGAEFIVVVCGAVMTMPGLPRVPAADSINLNKDGEIEGLF